jgi:hypothetical protein
VLAQRLLTIKDRKFRKGSVKFKEIDGAAITCDCHSWTVSLVTRIPRKRGYDGISSEDLVSDNGDDAVLMSWQWAHRDLLCMNHVHGNSTSAGCDGEEAGAGIEVEIQYR